MEAREEYGQGNVQKTDDYFFMKETIKRRPLNIGGYFRRVLAGGIFFGCSAALAIAFIYPAVGELVMAKEEISLSEASVVSGEAAQGTVESSMKAIVRVAGFYKGESDSGENYSVENETEGIVFFNSGTKLYILTSLQGMDETEEFRVVFSNDAAAQGTLCKEDFRTGVAVVSVLLDELTQKEQSGIYVAPLSETDFQEEGTQVAAVGSIPGEPDSLSTGQITSVSGILSSADCEYTMVDTDIQGSDGSRGVLLDMNGDVAGIVVGIREDDGTLQAVPAAQLRSLIENLSNCEKICYLGICGSSITEEEAEAMEFPQGVYVESVETDSPAMIAGIQNGDVLTMLDGHKVTDMSSYMEELQNLTVGSKIPVTLYRRGAEGKMVEIEYTLAIEEK